MDAEQNKMRSRLGMQGMPFSAAHNAESIFSRQKMPYFNVSRQNGVVLHNCNKNATLNKNKCFTESQKQRQRGREPERGGAGEREIQPKSQRERKSEPERENHREPERATESQIEPQRFSLALSDSLWLCLLTKPLLGSQQRYCATL